MPPWIMNLSTLAIAVGACVAIFFKPDGQERHGGNQRAPARTIHPMLSNTHKLESHMKTDWEMLDPRMTIDHLGYLPTFLSDDDPRPAKEQFAANYVGGWRPFKGFEMEKDHSISYPGDPTFSPLAQTKLRDELILFYPSSWVAIIQPDGKHEICRMD